MIILDGFIVGGAQAVLLSLAALGDEEKPCGNHRFFFVPIVVWSLGLVIGGVVMVLTCDAPSDRVIVSWQFAPASGRAQILLKRI